MKNLFFLFCCCFFVGCALKEPNWNYAGDVKKYRFVKISSIQPKSFESGAMLPIQGVGLIGMSGGESFDPKQSIAGELMKYGFLIVDEDQGEDTLFVAYGENGDATIENSGVPEVSIQLIDLKTKKLIYSCNAEGGRLKGVIGGFKYAISRCLAGLKAYFVPQTKSQKEQK